LLRLVVHADHGGEADLGLEGREVAAVQPHREVAGLGETDAALDAREVATGGALDAFGGAGHPVELRVDGHFGWEGSLISNISIFIHTPFVESPSIPPSIQNPLCKEKH